MLCMNFRLVDRIRVTVEKVDHISQKVGHPCFRSTQLRRKCFLEQLNDGFTAQAV